MVNAWNMAFTIPSVIIRALLFSYSVVLLNAFVTRRRALGGVFAPSRALTINCMICSILLKLVDSLKLDVTFSKAVPVRTRISRITFFSGSDRAEESFSMPTLRLSRTLRSPCSYIRLSFPRRHVIAVNVAAAQLNDWVWACREDLDRAHHVVPQQRLPTAGIA